MDHATSIETLIDFPHGHLPGESNPPFHVRATVVQRTVHYLSICLEGGGGGADADLALRLIQPEPEQPGGFVVVLFL